MPTSNHNATIMTLSNFNFLVCALQIQLTFLEC
jgi:hypothetical protein